ncbi:MAG: tetratricopeptide (TPR) repeat protein [Bradymonadia bacterium]
MLLHGVLNLDERAVVAGDCSADEVQVVLSDDAHEAEVLNRNLRSTVTTGHLLAAENTCRVGRSTDGTTTTVRLVDTVRCLAAAEVVTLHNTGETATLAGTGGIDDGAFEEERVVEHLADFVAVEFAFAHPHFTENLLRHLDTGSREHAQLRLRETAPTDVAVLLLAVCVFEADLDGCVSVFAFFTFLSDDRHRSHLHGGDRNTASGFVEYLRHADLSTENHFAHVDTCSVSQGDERASLCGALCWPRTRPFQEDAASTRHWWRGELTDDHDVVNLSARRMGSHRTPFHAKDRAVRCTLFIASFHGSASQCWKRLVLTALLAAFVGGCGVPQARWSFHRELLEADALADDGDHDRAQQLYERLLPQSDRDDLTRYVRYRIALMDERAGRFEDAIAGYELIYRTPQSAYDHDAAKAQVRAAELMRDVYGDDEAWLEMSLSVVERMPYTIDADDALSRVLRYWRETGQAVNFVAYAVEVYPALANTGVADNLVYWSGRVLQEDLGEPRAALEMYEVIRFRFQRSGFWDDAIWRTSLAYRQLAALEPDYIDEIGLSHRDVERRTLSNFLDAREVSWVMADYESAHYIPALRRMAQMAEEDGDLRGAIAAWQRFQRLYPISLNVDDVQYRVMQLQAAGGDLSGIESSIRWLEREYPHSRFIQRGRELLDLVRTGSPLPPLPEIEI